MRAIIQRARRLTNHPLGVLRPRSLAWHVCATLSVGPIQLVLLGFETTERFRGEIARELADLRGRGMIRVLDARLFHRSPEGKLTEVDLNLMLADPPPDHAIAHLLGANGGGGNGGSHTPAEALARTAGFALEDLRRLTEEIGPGDYAGALLVENVWAGRFAEAVRNAGGRLLGQGYLTPEVAMIIGAELEAKAEAEAAIELAEAARGAALVEALQTFAGHGDSSIEERTRACAQVVKVLVDKGFVHRPEAAAAIEALATSGLIETAMVQAAIAEAEDLLARGEAQG
jgi:hypothetical protein